MKNIRSILLTIGISLITFSCTNYLDEDIQGIYSSDTFYKTEEQAISALNAVYATAAFTKINNCLWVFGDIASDDAIKGGNPGDQAEIGFIDNFESTSANGYIEYIWQHYFEGITRANNVIHYVPEIAMNEDVSSRIIGEAQFFRAYFYFNLVNIFGEVPLKTEAALTTEALQVPLAQIDDIYFQIEKDLEAAAKVLPQEYDAAEKGRITKGAAYSLLAKVMLFEEKWQDALDAAQKAESTGNYSLLPVYRNNFSEEYENSSEAIIEFQHNSGQVPYEGSYLNQWFSPQKENGYYFNSPTASLYNEYEITSTGVVDPRRGYSLAGAGDEWLNGENFDPAWSPTGYMSKKHCEPLDIVSAGHKGDGGLNYTYMRYSELLLIKAEALNELGMSTEALTPLNRVRKRARESYLYDDTITNGGSIPNGLLPNIENATPQEVREAIRHERRVELAMEFHRYFDLMRYGTTVAEQALSDKGFHYATNRYFPIPQSEIDANNAIN